MCRPCSEWPVQLLDYAAGLVVHGVEFCSLVRRVGVWGRGGSLSQDCGWLGFGWGWRQHLGAGLCVSA